MYNMISAGQVELSGITSNTIQEIVQRAIKESRTLPGILYLDASYLYCFENNDFPEVRKMTLLTRYDHSLAIEWHRLLERWYQDQTVHINDRLIKPIKISRTLDRVTNEGMQFLAECVTGGEGTDLRFRSIGDGDVAGDDPSPGAKILVHEVDRIDVTDNPDGGSLSRDGSTIYSIGNHAKEVPTPDNGVFTECGMHNTDSPATDILFDYSTFEDPVPHEQHANAPGSTTIVFMCSG